MIWKKELYNNFKKNARMAFINSDYYSALKNIECAAQIASYYNFIYSDNQLDELCAQIAASKILTRIGNKEVNKKKVVYIDSNCMDNHGLTQQYIRALRDLRYEVLFIRIAPVDDACKNIIRDVSEYEKGEIICFEKELDIFDKLKIIYERIYVYNPQYIFFHLLPWDTLACMLASLFQHPAVQKIYINAIDHTFWIGASFMDKIIEFRDWGRMVSCRFRGFKSEQCFKLPYYPIINNPQPFNGLPVETNGKVIIFSGGQSYKMLDRHQTFFCLIDRILEENSNAIIVLISLGYNKVIEKSIKKCKNKDRIIKLGYRKDIFELYGHIDIYLSTFPLGGGLMSQYAAICEKPILSYIGKGNANRSISSFFNDNVDAVKSFTNMSDYFEYAHQLCKDKNFRISEGKKIRAAIQVPHQFKDGLSDIMERNISPYPFNNVEIRQEEYEHVCEETENGYLRRALSIVWSANRWKSFLLFPKNAFAIAKYVTVKKVRKIFSL